MTRRSIEEYVAALRPRYQRAGRRERGRILNEFVQTTGYHRKAAIRLLNRPAERPPRAKQGRRPVYGQAVVTALRRLWEASGHLCGKRLRPFLPELVTALRRHGELALEPAVEQALGNISAATIDRLLRPFRAQRPKPLSTTKPATLLKSAIPIRTFTDWDDARPGFLEVDLVAHCGESTEGFYLNTLNAVDIATGWTEPQVVWGKGQERVGGGVHHISRRLPFPLLGLDSDNGGEFINQHLLTYCRKHQITFTRARPYKKNDNAHIEQKNWTAVRRVVGYGRYSSKEAFAAFEQLYRPLRLYINYFQPVMKLVSKKRQGAKVRKRYDDAQTPYQRVLASGMLPEAQREALTSQYEQLNPVALLRQVHQALERLWILADTQHRTEDPERE